MKCDRFRVCALVIAALANASPSAFAQPNITSDPRESFRQVISHLERTAEKSRTLSLGYQLDHHFSAAPANQTKLANTYRIRSCRDTLVVGTDLMVYVTTPNRAFLLHRQSKEQPYAIAAISPISSSPRTPAEVTAFERSVEGGAGGAFRVTSHAVLPGALSIGSENSGLVRGCEKSDAFVHRFTCRAEPVADQPHSVSIDGFIEVDSRLDFKITKYQMATKGGTRDYVTTISCGYYAAEGDMPILIKTCQQFVSSPRFVKENRYNDFHYSNYELQPIPPEVLTLEHYGVTDPLRSTGSATWPYILVGVGAVGIGVYLFFRKRKR